MSAPEKVSLSRSLTSAVYILTVLTIFLLVGAFFFLASLSVWWQPESSESLTAVTPSPTMAIAYQLAAESSNESQNRDVADEAYAAIGDDTAVSGLPKPLSEEVQAVEDDVPQFGKLIISDIDVNQGVIPIFVRDGQWDIRDIGSAIGHLETTGAFPGDALAMTFTGHVTLPWPKISGPFADLILLEHGEEIVYRWNGIDYIYQVERIFRANPQSVHLLYEEDGEKLILVTCSGWDVNGREYAERLVTRAVLVRQEPTSQNTD